MSERRRLSLPGSVALGTGVMIGAGIFALVGQVAGLVGSWFPLAFVGGAIVAAVSSYAYARYSSVNPSSGGIAMLLRDAYGPSVLAGSCAMFMVVSMVVAESLLARTFGTYLLAPFGLEGSPVLVPVLGVVAIVAATVANLVGNRLVEGSAVVTAALKIVGIAVLAIGGLVATFVVRGGPVEQSSWAPPDAVDALAAVALSVLAYKGFTTIATQGDDVRDPERTLPRSIGWSIALCALLYVLLSSSALTSLGADGASAARDSALAEAARPLLGGVGVVITAVVAVLATLSGLLASLFAVSRMVGMLQDMQQAPRLPDGVQHQALLLPAGVAIVLTVALDLAQIASVGIVLYLLMDVAVQWAMVGRLREKTHARRWLPVTTIVLDVAILAAFVVVKAGSDPWTLAIAGAMALVIVLAQVVAVRRRDDG